MASQGWGSHTEILTRTPRLTSGTTGTQVRRGASAFNDSGFEIEILLSI